MSIYIETIHGPYPPVICDLCLGHGDTISVGNGRFKIISIEEPTHGYGGCTVYRIHGTWCGKRPKDSPTDRKSLPCVEFWLHDGHSYFNTNTINLYEKISTSIIPIGRQLELSGHPQIDQSPHV